MLSQVTEIREVDRMWRFLHLIAVAIFIHLAGKIGAISANGLRFRGGLNVTIQSSPMLDHEKVCVEELINLTCQTDQQVKNVTWYWSDQSEEGSRITVRATPNEVVYICEATSDNGETGEANITVVANGTVSMSRQSDYYYRN